MNIEEITGARYLEMIGQGCVRLDANRKTINDLNVFPIPDGDTGDNMFMTINAGRESGLATAGQALGDVSKVVSQGMLLGARGNSGVILSRIFAGIAKGLDGRESADVQTFAMAMHCGVEEAYNAVSNPVEGTILTVLKDSVNAAVANTDFESYFKALTAEMKSSLDRTPELLPVLKEAGVVDSGGAGMLCIATGMLEALQGEVSSINASGDVPSAGSAHTPDLSLFTEDSELEFGYCTEFLLRLQRAKIADLDAFDETVIREYLNSVGESVVCFRDGSIVKVHVHTMDPGSILSHCRQWGEYLTIKVENMSLQHEETTIRNNFTAPDAEPLIEKARKSYGVVTVASGAGLVNTFKEAGADVVIAGGQTMNPSAQSFIEAFGQISADTIFVFPNNSNIVMTAQQAASLYEASRIIVIPSKTIGAGYVGIASLDFSCKDADELAQAANAAIDGVTTGLITTATRDTVMDGVEVHEGDYLAICGHDIVADNPDREELLQTLAEKAKTVEHDVAILFYGEDVHESEAEAALKDLIAKYPRTEFMLTDGGQPVYSYILVLC